ncbi:glycosyltransferase family 25 protein [Pseudorhodobacter sp. W20_MBD10_FR17]|uniref:glycosyltransferase family 25 protein n=1 Tax=Pseudorhodobacter sp. W20_MBD10_FR17 TaxID=3240266 RepID=UPI003F95FB94
MQIKDLGIWLINLPRDEQRRAAMEIQLKVLGLRWQLFEAVDGKARENELLSGADEIAYRRNMGSSLLPGKLGVYASHLAVWDALIESDHEIALILEDDVVFHEDFIESLATAIEGRDHWDLVRFNAIRAKLPVTQGTLGRYRLNAYVGPFTGNACYLIKRDVAARLLPGLRPQTRACDHELNRFFVHGYRQRGLEPFASHPDDGNVSTITGTGFAKVRKFKWYKRLPHYRLKAANYFRRFFYLVKTGALPGHTGPLSRRKD